MRVDLMVGGKVVKMVELMAKKKVDGWVEQKGKKLGAELVGLLVDWMVDLMVVMLAAWLVYMLGHQMVEVKVVRWGYLLELQMVALLDDHWENPMVG
jgi:hypothetical protein